jgi:hypothetical protein
MILGRQNTIVASQNENPPLMPAIMTPAGPLDLATILLGNRVIFVGQYINSQVAQRVISQLVTLAAVDEEADILVSMHSCYWSPSVVQQQTLDYSFIVLYYTISLSPSIILLLFCMITLNSSLLFCIILYHFCIMQIVFLFIRSIWTALVEVSTPS